MIEIRHDIARRLETLLRDLKPRIVELWDETALKKSARLYFSNPLPGAVYSRIFAEFIDTFCDALGREQLDAAAAFWPERARTGRLSAHTRDEVAHLCTTASRSISDAVRTATEGADDALSLHLALQNVLAEIREHVMSAPMAPPAKPPKPQTAPPLDALVAAAEGLRQRLVWSDLYARDVRRSRRLESLRLMLLEHRGVPPAKAAEALLCRLYDELPCRVCLFVRFLGRDRGVRLENAWPSDNLGRELGEEIPLDEEALARLEGALAGQPLAIQHEIGGIEAEVARSGARTMFVLRVDPGSDPAGWLVLGTDAADALAPDDVEYLQAAAAVFGAVLENAMFSIQSGAAARRLQDAVRAAPDPMSAPVMRNAPVGMAAVDPAGRVISANETLARMLKPGATAADAIVGLDLIAGEGAPLASFADRFREALQRESFATLPFKWLASPGAEERWLVVRGSRFAEKETTTERMLLVFDDVSRQVQRQKQLTEREKIAAARTLIEHLARALDARLEPLLVHAHALRQGRIGIREMALVNEIERAARAAKDAVEALLARSRQTAGPDAPA